MDKHFSIKHLAIWAMLLVSFMMQAQNIAQQSKGKTPTFTEKDLKIDTTKTTVTHFEKRFNERYNSDDFDYQEKKIEEGLWERFKRWLNDKLRQIFGSPDSDKTFDIASIIFKTIAIAIILFAIYFIIKAILNKEGNWVFGKSTTKKIIQYEDIERNLQNVDFEKLINSTLQQGNTRLAVRYYYLWILKKMSQKSIINWNVEKTNSDYLYEIKDNNLREDFNYVSYLYDYIWYGEFDLDQNTFEIAKNKFEKTLHSI